MTAEEKLKELRRIVNILAKLDKAMVHGYYL